MVEQFKALYEIIDRHERELYKLLFNAVGHRFKFIDKNGVNYEIYVEYFRSFTEIGVIHVNESESVVDEWDITDFYEIIKESVEIE